MTAGFKLETPAGFVGIRIVVSFARPHRAIVAPVKVEGVKVIFLPTERDLDHAMEAVERQVSRNEHAPPDHRRNTDKVDLELVHRGRGIGHDLRTRRAPKIFMLSFYPFPVPRP